jgi:thioredoxin-related protein
MTSPIKAIYLCTILCLTGMRSLDAQTPVKNDQSEKKTKTAQKGIQWISLEEAEAKMKVEPKKVYIDLFTDWCYWCKVMDKKTFTNPSVTDYLNQHFYCIHIDAETKDSILFQGKKYGRLPNSKTNDLAAQWMKDRISYPSSIFMEEGFVNPQPVPGYLEIPVMEMILKYFGENKHKTTPWETWSKTFKGVWK